jgi:hypothetical protein
MDALVRPRFGPQQAIADHHGQQRQHLVRDGNHAPLVLLPGAGHVRRDIPVEIRIVLGRHFDAGAAPRPPARRSGAGPGPPVPAASRSARSCRPAQCPASSGNCTARAGQRRIRLQEFRDPRSERDDLRLTPGDHLVAESHDLRRGRTARLVLVHHPHLHDLLAPTHQGHHPPLGGGVDRASLRSVLP